MLAVRLDQEVESRLERLAKKTGRTKTYYSREAILEHLEDMEDYYLAVETLHNPGKIYSASRAARVFKRFSSYDTDARRGSRLFSGLRYLAADQNHIRRRRAHMIAERDTLPCHSSSCKNRLFP